MKIATNNRPYINGHGKAPRGRGSWAFEVEVKGFRYGTMFIHGNKTLTEARNALVAQIKAGSTPVPASLSRLTYTISTLP